MGCGCGPNRGPPVAEPRRRRAKYRTGLIPVPARESGRDLLMYRALLLLRWGGRVRHESAVRLQSLVELDAVAGVELYRAIGAEPLGLELSGDARVGHPLLLEAHQEIEDAPDVAARRADLVLHELRGILMRRHQDGRAECLDAVERRQPAV